MTQDELERTVRRLVDKDEIVDLVHRYSYCLDHQLAEEVLALFTDDCILDYGRPVGPPLRGIEALRAMFGLTASAGDAPAAVGDIGDMATSHHNANVLVTFDGANRADVRTSLYVWHRFAKDHQPRLWGYYYDVVVRTPAGWRFAERQLRIAGSENWDGDWHPLRG